MSRRAFLLKLTLFLGPFALVFALPLVLLARSYEIAPVSVIAARHAHAPARAVYGPAYSNPDKGYKFASLEQRKPPVVAVGTSRVMQFRADLFRGNEDTFYNAGGIVTRIFDYRVLFERMQSLPTRQALVGLDPWAFNEKWGEFSPDPGLAQEYDGEYSTLDVIQRSLHVYPDLLAGKFALAKFTGDNDSFGINGMSHGNGFLRDGSYYYADALQHPQSAPDYGFRDTLARIRTGTARFEPGDAPSERALAELDALAELWETSHFSVVAFLPPFAPSVLDAMRATGRHDYVFHLADAIRATLARHHVPFLDFTSCTGSPAAEVQRSGSPLAAAEVQRSCQDSDFVDGFHGGSKVYAKMLLELADQAPWLDRVTDRESIAARLARPSASAASWELASAP